MRTAVVTDSNSGITQLQAKEAGVYVIPMPFMIDGATFYEDIDLSQEEFYERMEAGSDITTSQPSPDTILKLWDQLLEEYDAVLHIPMSSGLSGACQTASMLAGDYDGKVLIVNNQRISVTQRQSVLDAKVMADQGVPASKIRDILEESKFDSSIYITVDTLKYLKKGGRITPAAAALGTLLKIKPVLTIQGEKLDAFAKARTMKQAKAMMISAIGRDLTERFGDPEAEGDFLQIAHTRNREAALEFQKELQTAYPNAEIYVDDLALSIACHVGPGTLAVACTRKLELQ